MLRSVLFIVSIFFPHFLAIGQEKADSTQESEIILDPIETSATFPGGFDAMKKFIDRNIERPRHSPKGKVFVEFIVNKDGSLSDFKVVRGLNSQCDEQALTVLKKMPNWIPGTQADIPVRQRFTMPVQF